MKKSFLATTLVLIIKVTLGQDHDLTGAVGGTQNQGSFGDSKSISDNVNLSLGIVSPTIPITTISGRDLSTSVSLIYTSGGGIKVNDYASSVGLGWTLNCGGYIKRTVRGKRDEKKYNTAPYGSDQLGTRGWLDDLSGTLTGGDEDILHYSVGGLMGQAIQNDYTYRNGAPGGQDPDDWDHSRAHLYYGSIHHNPVAAWNYDTEPDLFEFSFNGISGSFVLDETGNAMLLPHQDLLVSTALHSSGSSNQWAFTTPDGTQYIFLNNPSYYEVTHEITHTGVADNPNSPEDESLNEIEYISTWYLSQIISRNGDVITFNYASGADVTYTYSANALQDYIGGWVNTGGGTHTTATAPTFSLNSSTTDINITSPKHLSSISTCNGHIDFIENTSMRSDLNSSNQHALQFIRQYNSSNTLMKEFELKTSYFVGDAGLSYNSSKLRLDGIQQNSINGSQLPLPYRFHYNESIKIPSRNTATQDWFGYYNSNSSSNLISATLRNDPYLGYMASFAGANRDYNFTRASAAILEEILLPTGGSIKYTYEQNDFTNATVNCAVIGGLRIKKIEKLDESGNGITSMYNYRKASPYSNQSSGELNPSVNFCDYSTGMIYSYDLNLYFALHNDGSLDRTQYFVSRTSFPNFVHATDYLRYSHVEVVQQGNGKTCYDLTAFSSNPDVAPTVGNFWYNMFSWMPGMLYKPTHIEGEYGDLSFQRGLITKIQVYNESGQPLKETDNVYDFNPSNFTSKTIKAVKAFPNNYFTVIPGSWTPYSYHIEFYDISSKEIRLSQTVEKDFDAANPSNVMSTTTNFYYQSALHDQVTTIEKVLPDGKINCTYLKYSLDYNFPHSGGLDVESQGILNLQNAGVNCVILTVNSEIQSQDEYLLGGAIKSVKDFSGKTLPYKNYSMDLIKPEYITVPPFYDVDHRYQLITQNYSFINSSGTFAMDGKFKPKSEAVCYNSYGKPIESKSLLGRQMVSSTKYSTDGTKVIAGFKNSSITGDECDYWDFEGNTGAITVDPDAHSGIKSNKVVAGSSSTYSYSKQFNPSNKKQQYVVSAWIKTEQSYQSQGGEIVVRALDNTSATLSCPSCYQSMRFDDSNGKWNYVEAVLDLNKVATETGTNDLHFSVYAVNYDHNHYFLIDDVIIKPVLATSQVSNYDPVFDVAVSNGGNRNIYLFSELDSYGRIIQKRDADKNILLKRTYNPASVIDARITGPVTGYWFHNYTFESWNSFSNKTPVTYQWDYGDGAQSSGMSGSHSYSTLGTFTVSLRITDNFGYYRVAHQTIQINPEPLNVSVTTTGCAAIINPHKCEVDVQHGNNGSRTFTCTTTGGVTPYSYAWTLNGSQSGSNSNHLTINYDYTDDTNDFDAWCVVTDAQGVTQSDHYTIHIVCPNCPH